MRQAKQFFKQFILHSDKYHKNCQRTKFFYWKNLRHGALSILPNAGFFAETAGTDKQSGEAMDGTSGDVTLGLLGLDVYVGGRVSTGVTFQRPLSQYLGEGTIRAGNRWMFSLNYIF